MENLAKSILNYFATFTETRFNFSKKLAYRWSDDAATIDLCVFPDFEEELLSCFRSDQAFSLDVPKGRYSVELDADVFRDRLLQSLEAQFSEAFLASCIERAKSSLRESRADQGIEVDGDGQATPGGTNEAFERGSAHSRSRRRA